MDVLARLAEPAHLEDPYPFLSWLREHDPVHRAPDGTYFVSRHADIVQVLAGSGGDFPSPAPGPDAVAAARPCLRPLMNGLTSKNPPELTRLRKHATRGFTARRVDELLPGIERITDGLLDSVEERLRDNETVDLHAAFSGRLPLAVISELLGIPSADRESVAGLVRDIVLVVSSATASEPQLAAADAASAELEGYFRELIARRRREPEDDLVSALLATHDQDPAQLAEAEVRRLIWGFWVAGFETVATVVDHGVLAMAEHPDELHWLAGGHAKALRFGEEVLRHRSVVLFPGTVRIAARDVELSGGTVPRGATVRVLVAAANRDPRVFADPDRFDPGRDGAQMLGFGHGLHLCLGARLARTEIAVALAKLHARLPGLVAGRPERRPSVGLRVVDRLPVRYPIGQI